MALRIEDYALIGDGHTAALVGRDGSIDWLCVPRFDSPACFAALLGSPTMGGGRSRRAAPSSRAASLPRQTLVLETDFKTAGGVVRVVDCMPLVGGPHRHRAQRRVAFAARSRMRMELVIRFDYGAIVPWVAQIDGSLLAIAGPDTLELGARVPTHGERLTTVARFTLRAGRARYLRADLRRLARTAPPLLDPEAAVDATDTPGAEWSARCATTGAGRTR